MALSFGLNVKPRNGSGPAPSKGSALKKSTIFDSDPESEDDGDAVQSGPKEEGIDTVSFSTSKPTAGLSKPASRTQRQSTTKPPPSLNDRRHGTDKTDYRDLASEREAARHQRQAEELDSSIYDYDAFHATKSSMDAARKAAARQDAIERKPKYMDNLLSAASRRKQDQLVAREKLLQKERENEGDEFADKEKFVTGAYKAQQEEARKIAEEEEKTRLEEEKRRKEGMGGMQGFYRGVMAEQEDRHREAMEAAERVARGEGLGEGEKVENGEEKDRELVEELRRQGKEVTVNEEGQVTDKRQLLSAGLNVAPSGKKNAPGSEHLRTNKDKAKEAVTARTMNRYDQKAMRERQTRMLEEQLAATAKRAADEEAEDQRKLEHAAKSRKTENDVMSAKERYLARKKEREEAAKKGG